MMKKMILSFILLGLFSISLFAQEVTIQAKVIDVETHRALPNATISVSPEKSTIANADGEFVIEAEPQEMLTISYVGYKPVSIKAERVGAVIQLSPYAIELSEVKVLPLKTILEKVVSALKAETDIYKKQESNFYYRQMTQNNGECSEYIEAFLNGFSEVALRQPSIINGRYGELKQTDTKKYSYVGNYLSGTCISPYTSKKIRKKWVIVPMMANSGNLYQVDYDILSDKAQDKVLYKIVFTPHAKVKAPIVRGVIYVDADTYRIQKYEGEILNYYIIDKQGKHYDMKESFSVTYTYRRGFTEVQSVSTKGAYSKKGISVNINSTLVNVGLKYYEGKKKLGASYILKNKISSVDYDAKFWNDNTIIKRTPMEEQVVKMFEKDNVFSNMTE